MQSDNNLQKKRPPEKDSKKEVKKPNFLLEFEMQIELKGRPFSHPQIVGKMSYWGNQGGRRSLSPIRGRGDRERGRSDGRAAEKFVNPSRSYPGINPPKPQLIGAASSNLSASNNSTYQNAPPPLFPSAAYTREEHLQSKQSSGSEPDHVVAEQLFPPGKTSDLQIRLNKAPNQRYIGMKLASPHWDKNFLFIQKFPRI